MKTRGNNDDTLHMIVRRARLEKSLSVTPRTFVNAAPTSVPTVLAPLYIDIKVANSTASTPGGHSLAARTNVGKNAISPAKVCTCCKR